MKILVVGHSFVVDTNRKIWKELSDLSESNHVDIIVPKAWRSNLISELNYVHNEDVDACFTSVFPVKCFFKGNGSLYFFNPIRIIQILLSNKYDAIVLAQETWSLSLFFFNLLRLLGINRRAKFYIWICQNIKKPHLYFLRFFERFNCLTVTKILVCCEEAAEVIKWKKIKTPCGYFPFSFDSSLYKKIPLNYAKSDFRVGYMGRISEEKGVKALLSAIELLKNENINISLTIAGAGDLEPLLSEYENVEYLGVLRHSEAHKFYENIDLFVLPSETRKFWKEQFGRVIVESVATGRPVLGSNSGAIPEVLGKLELPFIFEEGNIEDLVMQINKIIKIYEDGKMDDLLNHSYKKILNYFLKKVSQICL